METLTKEQIIELLKDLEEFNPYPESVFIPVPDEKMEFAARTLKDLNLSPDAIFGHWGRQVWNNCVEKAEEILSELIEKESEVRTAEEYMEDHSQKPNHNGQYCLYPKVLYGYMIDFASQLRQPEKEQPSDEDIEGWLDVEFALYKYPKSRKERKVNTMTCLVRDGIRYSLKAMRDGKIPVKSK